MIAEHELVTSEALEAKLGVSRSTLWRLRQRGLPCLHVGRGVRYRASEVQAWLLREGIGDQHRLPNAAKELDRLGPIQSIQMGIFVNEPAPSYSDSSSARDELPACHWSAAVALDPKHRPQTPDAPSTTVRKDWRKYPQEAHLLDVRGHRFRRFTEDEIAVLQGFPPDWGKGLGLTHRERIAGLGNAVPPQLGEALHRAAAMVLGSPLRTSIEICAGFGGLALGAHRASNVEALALVEFWDAAARVLRSSGCWNPSRVHLANVLDFDWRQFAGEVDVLSGGPPCQPWSRAGHSKGASDERDLLGFMPRLVRTLLPKAFIFENVPGLISPDHAGYLEWLVGELRDAGDYGVAVGVFQAADFGVPQRRKRVIIAGFRGHSDGVAHRFFDQVAALRTHADPSRALPPGRRSWVTIGEALPAWRDGPGWRRWLDVPNEIQPMSATSTNTNQAPADAALPQLNRRPPAMGLIWPGRDHAVRWSAGHWVVDEALDTPSSSAAPLLRVDNNGRALIDPWYLGGEHVGSLEALRSALGRRGKLVYFEPPRLDTDLVSFAAEDSRTRLNTWLTLNQATVRRALSLVRDDGVLILLTGVAEQPYLQVLLDEMIGPENRVGTVVWQKGYSVQGQNKDKPKNEIYPTHDYLLVYSRRREECLPGAALKSPPQNFTNPDGDPRGPWKAEQKGANYARASSDFTINLPPYRWEIVDGETPPWFWRISPKSGVIWAPGERIQRPGSWKIRIRATDSQGTSCEREFVLRVRESGVAPEPRAPSWLIARDEQGRPTNSASPANAPSAGGPLEIISTELPVGVVGKPYYACLQATGGTPYIGTTRPGKSSETGKSRYWDVSYSTLELEAAQDNVDFKSKDDSIPAVKVHLDGASYTYVNQISTWRGDGKGKTTGGKPDPARVGWGQDAKKELEELLRLGFVEKVVNIGKPAGLMSRLLGLFTTDGDYVVDIGSPTAEMASVACQLNRRSVYVEIPGTNEDSEKIRLPRLLAAARGLHPLPDGVLFSGTGDDPNPLGYYVGHRPRDRRPEASVCCFKVGAPLLVVEQQTSAPLLDYVEYPSGSLLFLQALASIEGLVWSAGSDGEFARSHDGRIIAVHFDGRSVLDGRTIEMLRERYANHLTEAGNTVRVYYHRGYEDVQPPGGTIELRHVPFGLALAGGDWV